MTQKLNREKRTENKPNITACIKYKRYYQVFQFSLSFFYSPRMFKHYHKAFRLLRFDVMFEAIVSYPRAFFLHFLNFAKIKFFC